MNGGHCGALATDLYQLTMAQGYWDAGLADRDAVFHLSFRRSPFGGGFTVAAGIEAAIELAEGFRFSDEDLDYLADLRGSDGEAIFQSEFLAVLGGWERRCSIDVMPEGTVVFPREPILRVTGPILEAQILETGLLSIVNHQSLVATKAARVRQAAGDDEVVDFGFRRAHGVEAAMAAARAAYVGGVDATSNVEAGRRWGIPVRGTHAHSWVQAFDDELSAFRCFVRTMPRGAVLLVDTYQTRGGVENAITVARELRDRGGELAGIRLDSGDLWSLSRLARTALDEAGFPKVAIVASGDLDEDRIAELKRRGAPIGIWGVGTRLVTGAPDAALAGVYKLGALRDQDGRWSDRSKRSDEPGKESIPGILDVVRLRFDGRPVGDGIFDARHEPPTVWRAFEWPLRPAGARDHGDLEGRSLLETRLRRGERVGEAPALAEARQRAAEGLATMGPGVLSRRAPAAYPVGLEKSLSKRLWQGLEPSV